MNETMIPDSPPAKRSQLAGALRAAMRDSVVGHRVLMTAGLEIPQPVIGKRFPFGMAWEEADASPEAHSGAV